MPRDIEFNSAFSNVLIYVFRINDEDHKGYLKIGKATIKADRATVPTLVPNCSLLNKAAKARIDQYTKTANIAYDLLHTELAIRPKKDDPTRNEYFMDTDVHKVLLHSNIKRKETDGAKEWFKCNLETAKNAINAARHHEYSLTPGEVSTSRDPIVFRPEQQQAIDDTIKCFRTHNKMLWNAKMRFGKTLTSLQVVKDLNFRKTIIITHRPVVKASWGEDFEKIFYDSPDWHYIKKDATTPDVEPDVNRYITGDKPFVLFASMQDLRGSKLVGGKFDKNELILNTEWDCVIVDEAHEGTKTSLGDNVLKIIIKADKYGKTKVIYLSGTPFNLVEDFEEAEVFTWDYVMEQSRKAEWDIAHRLDPNPYENLPVLYIYTYDLAQEIRGFIEAEDRAFNFREFFRVWTGKVKQDGKALNDDSLIGRFVHEDEVRSFLNLLADKTVNSNYPYSREIYRDYFRHSLWMLPGVKEAKALSELLREHPIFRGFGIANVAGDGDEEKDSKDALEEVNKKITKHPEKTYTITLSCGRLTTGVTVPPWTAVLMLAGSYSVSASNYLQTIFRVQSPANIDGQIKDKCFVFDFAPDRTLKMVAEAGKLSTRPGKNDESSEKQMGDLLNFCPVISIEGSLMKAYDVDSMLQQIKRIYAERVVKNGFDDPKLYNDKLLHLTDLEIDKFDGLKKIVGASKAMDTNRDVTISNAGLTKEDRELLEKAKKKKKTELTPEEKERLEKLKKAKEERGKAISILRAISIRIPLMIYGAEIPFDGDITIENFIDLVDDQSWVEFMPNKVTKDLFRQFMEYYDKDIFIAAGKSIRALVKGADELDPTTRVKRIAEVFSMFKNPDKETVLTPWRVVNMHMSETLGGWDFFAEDHQEQLDEPRFVDNGDVTRQCLSPDSKVLEINSKTGLYPLYVTYSIFRERCKGISEAELTWGKQQELWRKTVDENMYVVCKTKMARSITKRSLLGYKPGKINAHAFEDLANQFINKADQVCERITGSSFWDKKGARQDMRFDAIVGNPPFQEETAKQQSETNGQVTRKSIFQHFQLAADEMTSGYTSLIYPGARWIHRSGKGMAQFGLEQINDVKLERLDFFVNADEVFKDVAIADGISIVLKNKHKTTPGFEYVFHRDGKSISVRMDNPGSVLMTLNPENDIIVQKVMAFVNKNTLSFLDSRVLPRDLFGIESDFVEKNPSKVSEFNNESEIDFSREIKLFTNDKAGKAGRARWYKTERNNIPSGREKIDEWQVVVSSANAGGQKRDNQLQVIDNHSAFGRSRVALASFKTREEAENFYKYCQTDMVRFMFLMTDEALTSLGKKVPDLKDYTSKNMFLDFSKPLNEQINTLFDFTEAESQQMKNRIPER
jgi:hypothetical protein